MALDVEVTVRGRGRRGGQFDGSIPGEGVLALRNSGKYLATLAADGSGVARGLGTLEIHSADGVTAALTGTFLTTPTEAEVVTGGQTIIITLTGGTWVAAGATFNAQRQNIIDGITSDGEEETGWNAEVRDKAAVTTMTRTNATTATFMIPASASYAIDENETLTVTVPASAVNLATDAIVATPTVEIVAA